MPFISLHKIRLTATKVDSTYLGCLISNAQRICPVAGLERITTGLVVSALPYRETQVDKLMPQGCILVKRNDVM